MKISVVIPTRNRCGLLRLCLESLASQTLPPESYEIIVVDDGSADGTPDVLRGHAPSHAFRHLRQDHGGLSAARNAGNREATAPLILALDDDMIASPRLLEAHVQAHREHPGCLIQGALRIHESVERTPWVEYQESWLESDHRRRASGSSKLRGEDVWGGNISISRSLLDSVGGFNERLKRLRNTDGELAYRLERRGVGIHYAAEALASMTHVNDFDAALGASVLYGRSYVFMQQVYPETVWKHSPLLTDRGSALRNVFRRMIFAGGTPAADALTRLARIALRLAQALALRRLSAAFYRLALDAQFWKGVQAESGGQMSRFRPRGIPILCYHHVSDVRNRRFRRYILPVATFRGQIDWLRAKGYQALSLDALFEYLEQGAPLPDRPVVITFDDGYGELETTATPILVRAGFPHTHFINTGKIGGATDWIEAAPDLPILSAEQIRRMAAEHPGLVEFQAHGRGHLFLPKHDREKVVEEVRHCIEVLEPLTGRPVRYMAYPFGEQNETTRAAMRELPLRLSFTVDQGLCRPGQDPHRLPRVEVFTTDSALDFRFKVRYGFSPVVTARRKLKRVYKKVLRRAGLRR